MLAKFRAWYNDGTPDGYFVYWSSAQLDDPLADFIAGDYNLFTDFTIVEYVGDSGSSFQSNVTWGAGVEEGNLVSIDQFSSTAILADISSWASASVKGIASSASNRINLGGICDVKFILTIPGTLSIGQKLYLSQTSPGFATESVPYVSGNIIAQIGFCLENTELGATTCRIMFSPLEPIIVDDTIIIEVG